MIYDIYNFDKSICCLCVNNTYYEKRVRISYLYIFCFSHLPNHPKMEDEEQGDDDNIIWLRNTEKGKAIIDDGHGNQSHRTPCFHIDCHSFIFKFHRHQTCQCDKNTQSCTNAHEKVFCISMRKRYMFGQIA